MTQPAKYNNRIHAMRSGIVVLLLLSLAGCDQPKPATAPRAKPTVASLVPAATDLIIGMGAGDQLVAVSNYDRARPDVRELPKVGDYLTTDWEQLAQVRPDLMIVQLDPERMPQGLAQRAQSLNIRLINVSIHRLDDIFKTWTQLGDAMRDDEQAQTHVDQLRQQLDAIQASHSKRPPVRTLLVLNADAQAVVGHDNFLNDLLVLAGGVNVVPENMGAWPSIDQELLVKLQPQAIVQLLPDASPQVMQQAARVWDGLKQLPAVEQNRVTILHEWFLLQPGAHVGDIAQLLADAIHKPSAPPDAQ